MTPIVPKRKTIAYEPPLTISRADYLREDSDDWFREALYQMVLAHGRLITCREAFGRHLGITASQFAVLIGVAYRQGERGVTVRALADHVSLAATHVTTEVGRLADRGLLDKQPCPDDRRSVRVSLTAAGEAAVADVAPLVRKFNDLLFQGISPDDLDAAAKVARQLALNSEYVLDEIRQARMRSADD